MEFVGRTVRKHFKELGVFSGVVNAYNPSTGLFQIVYEGGDSEELELSEIAPLVVATKNDQLVIEKPTTRVGRKPKKRHRFEAGGDSGNNSAIFISDGERLKEIVSVSNGFNGVRSDNGLNLNDELDLNAGLDLNDGFNVNVNCDENSKKNACIDLNLEANGDLEENLKEEGDLGGFVVGTQKREHCFDLNLGLDGEMKNIDADCEGQMVGGSKNVEEACFEVSEGTQVEAICRSALGDSHVGLAEEAQKEKDASGKLKGRYTPLAMDARDFMSTEVQLKERLSDAGAQLDPGYQHNSANMCKTRNRRKRRKLSENVDSAAEVVLRRSSRRLAEERTQRIEHCFDLNLGLDEEMKNADAECQGPVKENTSFLAIEEAQKQVTGGGVGDSKNGDEACFEVRALTQMEAIGISVENKVGNSCVRLPEEVQKEKCFSGGLNGSDIPRSTDAKDSLSSKVKLNLDTDIPLDHGYQGNSTSTCKERNRRKRRKLSDSVNSATERVLRRSNRRLETSLSAQNHVSSQAILFADDESQPSPAVSSALEEQPTTSCCEGFEENTALPSKLQLPPPSENLNLDGIPILDLFSVYTCLRSFSTLLFLSPFELEDFAEALKCKVPNMLFDFIHVSLLQTLRKHLEYLSDENSLTASNCLRSLNWDLLDLITWPIFMVEYLLTHGSGLKPGFDLCKLKLFESDYYKQPALVKIEILRCLCDDVIEVEAIRSELNRRTLATELNMDTDRIMKIETSKGRRTLVDVSGGSCLTEEVVEETTDWNSDECCLCKMDGNLICCDGCPAAYHLRCVGIANSLLPEGDWYCPECVIVKDKPWLKLEKSLRGAELLGVDPYGRLYYSSCGYLLVSDSPDNESSYHYYHRNDLTSVIEALKSLETLYSPILGAISKQWNISIDSNGAKSDVDSNNPTICLELMKGQIPTSPLLPLHLAPSETCVRDEIINDMKPEENAIAAQYSGNTDCEVSALVNDNSETLSNFVKMENPFSCSEGSAEMSQAAGIQNFPKTVPVGFSRFAGILNDSEIQGKIHSVGDTSLTSTSVDGVKGKNIQLADCGLISSVVQTRKGGTSQGQLGTDYVNYYTFARTASMVAEDLTRKPSDKITEGAIKSVDDIISAQLKAISKKSTKFSWPNIQNLNADVRKEKCGWCFSCKASDDDRDCFFKTNDSVSQGFTSERFGLHTKRDKKGHLIDVMCYILCVEDRLHGFLLGPWLNAHYINNWRKSVVKASDVASLKLLLLMLEANLRRLALSAEWLKHVDSVATMGSASHIVTTSTRMSSKNGIGRKRARNSDSEPNPSSNAATGLGLFWWRGGKLSRELFNWKVLPRSLASKAARQAGCTKIPGVLYPDSSEFAKRSKYVAWKAAVETSRSVEQLALQVRELDANIRWDDIENTNPLSKMDQFRKSVRPFKKVIIRRKCIEGTLVKYLLDFGKRRFIPDVVMTHGSMVEESSSGRKKYWLEESHVPLHLLKGFEEKRIARKSNKLSSGKLHGSEVIKKTSKKRGFSYLFTKAERSEYYQCGHCNKDVLIREAVCCRYCKGFFHKRHVRKSAGAITAKCTYTCHKCQDGKFVKIEAKKGALKSHISKKGSTVCRVLRSKMSKKACKDKKAMQQQKSRKDVVVLPLRRSARNVKCVSLQNKKLGVGNKGKGKGRGKGKGKQIQSRKGISKYSAKKMGISKKPKKGTWQKKRTWVYHTYWLNGLLLSRKPNDERVMHFRSEKLVTPSEELTAISGKPKPKPKCSLCCEQESTSTLNYVCCEFCGDWFHGDAFGLTLENIGYLIGFRCHKCRSRTPPVCPDLRREASDEAKVGELNTEAGNECADIIALPTELLEEHKFHTEENLSLDDGSSHNDHELGTVLSLNHLNAENCHLPLSEEQKREAIQIPDERRPDLSLESNEHVSVIENTTDMGTEHITAVTISVKTEFPLSKSDFNAIDTEMASLGHNNTEYDSVQTAI